MAQAMFIAGEDACVVFGCSFDPGEWVDVSGLDQDCQDRLAANPTFQFQADPPPQIKTSKKPDPAPSDAPVGGDADQ